MLDFDRWAQGIKDGRSYVSDGRSHLLDFRVDDTRVGEGADVHLEAAGTVKIRASVAAYLDPVATPEARLIHARPLKSKPYWSLERSRIGESRRVPVEVVVNGRPVARRDVEADGAMHELEFDVPIERSSWVALRIYPSSHTNPIFVTAADRPIRASKRSAEWCLSCVDRCWTQKQKLTRPSEREAAHAAYELARDAYRKILAEALAD